ncbi:MAG: 2Fe-2S iron-sulfur cluster binding domain-containing protein [Spirochaetales bacterium]|nr:2Fe-2S iron-sulfur cluster binding domain-containing protein [Spirochaetales bacterium]
MAFLPIVVMNLILLVITILLIIADRLLVNYGTCKITVEKDGEENSFEVQGGQPLLSYLIEAGYEINSSCGGRGTCGYCKVRVTEGGGQLLPTEEIFMSRAEKANNMRLACQCKVKNDIRIVIPNFLEIVREMVRNRKFDAKKRWLVTIK